MVEMATGFPGCAKAICDELRQRHPLTATLAYKSIYQHWSVGDPDVDRVADQAIALWPTHPAVWTACFWTRAHGGRLEAAAGMLDQPSTVSLWPAPLLAFLRLVLATRGSGQGSMRNDAIAASLELGRRGPVEANSALFALSLLGAVEEALDLCHAYYLGTAERSPIGRDKPHRR
jgi:hypothetical protein